MPSRVQLPSVARIAIPATIVMIAVVGYLAAGTWNRSRDPGLVITLTERELPLVEAPNAAPGDEPGVRLRIAYEYRADPLDARNWLPDSRLVEIGFPMQIPAGAPQAADVYDNVPPRVAWVAFEHDGPAYREFERRRLVAAPEPERHIPALRSRLVPVEAAADFESLRARHPSGHLIMRATIALRYLPPDRGGPLVHGALRELVPATISVPSSLREVFEGMSARTEPAAPAPRYEVDLAIGRLGLPYVWSARRLPSL